MSVIYGIWYPDYSNSSVGNAVYTSRDDADAVARESGGDVVEFDVDPPLDEKSQKLRRPGERFYTTSMNIDGNGAQATAQYPAELHPDEASGIRVNKAGKVERFNTACWAKDEKHAIKIANDRRTQWVAAGSHFSEDPHPAYTYGWRRVRVC